MMRPRTRMAFSWNLRPAGSAVMRPSPGRGEAHSGRIERTNAQLKGWLDRDKAAAAAS